MSVGGVQLLTIVSPFLGCNGSMFATFGRSANTAPRRLPGYASSARIPDNSPFGLRSICRKCRHLLKKSCGGSMSIGCLRYSYCQNTEASMSRARTLVLRPSGRLAECAYACVRAIAGVFVAEDQGANRWLLTAWQSIV